MEIRFLEQAVRQYKKLPHQLQKKTDKQLLFLRDNLKHPSLNVKKMEGEEKYEARVDWHYRLTFLIREQIIYILSIGPHDTGLGKK